MIKVADKLSDWISSVSWDSLLSSLVEVETYDSQPPRFDVSERYSRFLEELEILREAEDNPLRSSETLLTLVNKGQDAFIEEDYLDVCTLNEDFVEDPDETLKPWGGNYMERDDCPDGYYNCNWHGYNRVFGVNCIDLIPVLNGPVYAKNEESAQYVSRSVQRAIATILKEMSLYGFTQKARQAFVDELSDRLRSIEDGTAELLTMDEVRQHFFNSDAEVVKYRNPLKGRKDD